MKLSDNTKEILKNFSEINPNLKTFLDTNIIWKEFFQKNKEEFKNIRERLIEISHKLGISVSEYENVFKPFYKIDKSRNQTKSSVGLGLSITSDIIKSHGGNILLDKSPLKGLRVKIFLPL